MLATLQFFIFQILIQQLKTKIQAESHFNILKQPHGQDPPTNPPGGNDTQARKATHGGHNLHSKPPNPP